MPKVEQIAKGVFVHSWTPHDFEEEHGLQLYTAKCIERLLKLFPSPMDIKESIWIDEGQPRLLITVHTPLPSEEALRLLDQFDEEYWLDVESWVAKLVIVDVRYKPWS